VAAWLTDVMLAFEDQMAMRRQIMAAGRPRRPASLIGPAAVVVLVAAYAALWLIARPASSPSARRCASPPASSSSWP